MTDVSARSVDRKCYTKVILRITFFCRNSTWKEAEHTCKTMNYSLMSFRNGIADYSDMSNMILNKTLRDTGRIIFIGLQCKKTNTPYVNISFYDQVYAIRIYHLQSSHYPFL